MPGIFRPSSPCWISAAPTEQSAILDLNAAPRTIRSKMSAPGSYVAFSPGIRRELRIGPQCAGSHGDNAPS